MDNAKPKSKWGGKGFVAKKGDKLNERTNDAPGGRKATNEEVERRVEYCAYLLGVKMWTKTEIHHAFRKKYLLHKDVVDGIYIPRAHKWIKARTRLTKDQARDIGVGVILDVMKTGTNADRVRAEARFAAIFGYDETVRTEVSGLNGGPIKVEHRPYKDVPDDHLMRALAMLRPAPTNCDGRN